MSRVTALSRSSCLIRSYERNRSRSRASQPDDSKLAKPGADELGTGARNARSAEVTPKDPRSPDSGDNYVPTEDSWR
jgi:hypothetical protein